MSVLFMGLIVIGYIVGLHHVCNSRLPSDAFLTPAKAYTSMAFANTLQEVTQTIRQVAQQLQGKPCSL
ncbi:MAG: hypothetical protein NT023_20445 [Armatimonadetes bacterium]|nr:hypothetical protein [Armatimonadota bacterium]